MQAIFFDLDHTLWDFETNSCETISVLLDKYQDYTGGLVQTELFFNKYTRINKEVWAAYRKDEISQADLRIHRFEKSFAEIGIEKANWMLAFSEDYTEECPQKGALFPGAMELVKTLHKRTKLYIITNGFEDVQHRKLKYSGLAPYFEWVLTSESAGFKKPDPGIFHAAIRKSGLSHNRYLYVGDDYEADVKGASKAGMLPVFFNPDAKPNPDGFMEIRRLGELEKIYESV